MAKAIDIGTSFIVGAELKDGSEVFTTERDAFFSMPNEDFAEEMLDNAGAYYIRKNDRLFVVGEDALKFSMLTGRQEDYRRPMARGVLNPGEEEAVSMLELLIEGIIGKADTKGEVCAVTIPSAPIDDDYDTTFHRIVIERAIKRLGYEPHIINEALAIIYQTNPSVADDDGQTVPFTGIGISFGAGMTNLVVSWRASRLVEMSVSRGGDWIDEKTARARGVTESKVTAFKEKKLDLSSIDRKDGLAVALEIYYEDLIRYVLTNFEAQIKRSSSTIDVPMPIVIAGGTSIVPGFIETFERVLDETDLPFPIASVELASNPLKAVAGGALVASLSMEKKKGSEKKTKSAQAPASLGTREEVAADAAAANPLLDEDDVTDEVVKAARDGGD